MEDFSIIEQLSETVDELKKYFQNHVHNGVDNILISQANSLVSTTPMYDNGNSGTTKTINWLNGNRQKITLTANCTLTFTNPTNGQTTTLVIIQDATGSRTITWPTIKWVGATAPTLSTAASNIDIVSYIYDGTSYFATYSLNFA